MDRAAPSGAARSCLRYDPPMADAPDQTRSLLEQWHGGDRAALDRLLERDESWIRHRVRQRLGDKLREKLETQDVVQEAMVDVLRYGPKFLMSDLHEFRSLMARIIENNIRDQHGWMQARRRAGERETPLPSDTLLDMDSPVREVTRVTQAVFRQQRAELVRLAMEILEPEDRQIVYLRQWDKLPFDAVGEQLGMQPNTARMRFQRALLKLSKNIETLCGRDGAEGLVE
jgi:RNA polymerase sigma-70 factor, ECF subfamily